MATAITNTMLNQTSDAGFRAWIGEIRTQILAAGWLQTADTGQLDVATATRPAIDSTGYFIFRTDDSRRDILLKLECGSGAVTDRPVVFVTAGMATNGAGTLTGVTTTRVGLTTNTVLVTPGPSFTSYYAGNSGRFSCSMKRGCYGNDTVLGFFSISRINDITGARTEDGFLLRYGLNGSSFNRQKVLFSPDAAFAATTSVSYVTESATNTLTAGGPLYFPHTFLTRVGGMTSIDDITVVPTEVAEGATFSATPVGVTPRTYLSLGSFGPTNVGLTSAWLAMLWE